MPKKMWNVVIRRISTGEETERQIFADSEANARLRALARAKTAPGVVAAERKIGQFVVLSCKPRPAPERR